MTPIAHPNKNDEPIAAEKTEAIRVPVARCKKTNHSVVVNCKHNCNGKLNLSPNSLNGSFASSKMVGKLRSLYSETKNYCWFWSPNLALEILFLGYTRYSAFPWICSYCPLGIIYIWYSITVFQGTNAFFSLLVKLADAVIERHHNQGWTHERTLQWPSSRFDVTMPAMMQADLVERLWIFPFCVFCATVERLWVFGVRSESG